MLDINYLGVEILQVGKSYVPRERPPPSAQSELGETVSHMQTMPEFLAKRVDVISLNNSKNKCNFAHLSTHETLAEQPNNAWL